MIRRLNAALLVSGSMMALSACQPNVGATTPAQTPISASRASLVGTWHLTSFDGDPVLPNRVSVAFDTHGRFVATIDCNTATGVYSLQGAVLSISGAQTTERGCINPLPNEDMITRAMSSETYTIQFDTSSELHLSGAHRLVFSRVQ